MPSIEVPLAIYRMDLTFWVLYAVVPPTMPSSTGPGDDGLHIESVTCVEVTPLFGAAWPQEKINGLSDFLCNVFWSEYSGEDIRRFFWDDWAKRREAAREARMEA